MGWLDRFMWAAGAILDIILKLGFTCLVWTIWAIFKITKLHFICLKWAIGTIVKIILDSYDDPWHHPQLETPKGVLTIPIPGFLVVIIGALVLVGHFFGPPRPRSDTRPPLPAKDANERQLWLQFDRECERLLRIYEQEGQSEAWAEVLRVQGLGRILGKRAEAAAAAGSFSDDDSEVDPRENARYLSLRNQAREQGDLMKQTQLYSQQWRTYEQEKDRLDAQASAWIYQELNAGKPRNEIDLHCQYVREAIMWTDKAVTASIARGDKTLRIIVGRGLHTAGMEPKLRPAVKSHLERKNYTVRLGRKNPGVLEVTL